MAKAAVALGCILTGPERIPCDAVFIIECGHPAEEGSPVPGAVVLGCTLRPGHLGGLHRDIEGLWWRADG